MKYDKLVTQEYVPIFIGGFINADERWWLSDSPFSE